MAISMFTASVPVFQKFLGNLDHLLDKAAADAAARKYDPAVLLQSRLAPDMWPLIRQIQVACDFAKGTPARLAGVEAPKFEDTETTIEQARARVQKTLDYLKGFKAAQIDGSEERDVVFKTPRGDLKFKGLAYLLEFGLPNFYFHYTTVYALLRHNGVQIGKNDYAQGKAAS